MAQPRLDIDRLSPTERIRLTEELWSSLHATPADVPLTTVQAEELDRRLDAYREDREPGEPWRKALAGIGGKSTG